MELRRLMGVFGQFEGSWKNMLYLTVTARNDWSSTLPKENRSFFYPGITGSFIFSELLNDNLQDVKLLVRYAPAGVKQVTMLMCIWLILCMPNLPIEYLSVL